MLTAKPIKVTAAMRIEGLIQEADALLHAYMWGERIADRTAFLANRCRKALWRSNPRAVVNAIKANPVLLYVCNTCGISLAGWPARRRQYAQATTL